MMCFCSWKLNFPYETVSDPDEMPLYAAFHVGLHCLQKYLFIIIQDEKG